MVWRVLREWLADRRGNFTMALYAVLFATVVPALFLLVTAAPRYYMTYVRLQNATDAAATAAARCIDVPHFQNTGEVILDVGCARAEAFDRFQRTLAYLADRGYTFSLDRIDINDAQGRVTITATGEMPTIGIGIPVPPIRVAATAYYRMTTR